MAFSESPDGTRPQDGAAPAPRAPGFPPASPGREDGHATRLLRLEELREQRLVDRDEYAMARAQILADV